MTAQGLRWTSEQVLELAPDASSRSAANRLATPSPWSETGADGEAVWGRCAGSGGTRYQTVVDLLGNPAPAYRCSCPSRKFPCKHALALLLRWSEGETAVAPATGRPDWAREWLDARRARAERAVDGAAARGTGREPAKGAAGGETPGGARRRAPADPEAARRRAERRSQRVAAGATELEQRLADLLNGGLAGADRAGYARWDEMAARMVDAQAPGLASRVRELGSHTTGADWPGRLLSECALLHLLNVSCLRLDELPEPLAATVRTRVGHTVDSAELLADPAARVRDEWLVLGRRDETMGRLTARRIWLRGHRSGRTALLLSFGPPGGAPELALPVGLSVEADLAFHPGAPPLRAALGERYGPPGAGFVPDGEALPEAPAAYARALAEDPWLEGWPVVLRGVLPIPPGVDGGPEEWQLATEPAPEGWELGVPPADEAAGQGRSGEGPAPEDAGRAGGRETETGPEAAPSTEELGQRRAWVAVPVHPETASGALWKLLALSGGAPLTVFGEHGHRGFAPYSAWSADGTAVPL
ncbi:SWIM zinc finger family protein [Streptomyces sp. AJS327]|uniref:SWIM zinc finger family protein n=1 Tax=Streptomyces sp. AJS327 TaxID=2545265 RepID=UPI0015DEA8E0|nr:SWIM zinc finger family protein [Streptomyces sp. AJS327]MBA0054266.1 SWIM zinc finger family protein [Streptomyces sp. AJS327]